MSTLLPNKVCFFEVKDWEKTLINDNFKKDVMLCSETLTLDNYTEFKEATVISVFISSVLNEELLSKFPNLKVIATRSTGYDHVDIKYCQSKGITVCNVPSYGENTVAEHAMALLLALAKRIPESIDRVKQGNFLPDGLTGIDLKDRVLGVIGTGHIGVNMIQMANGFKMKVIAYDAFPKPALESELNFSYVDFNYLLKKSDVISIHVPYSEKTHHLINRDNVKDLKDKVILINTSRGGIIETDALYDGLRSGKIGGAGLDVVEQEQFIKEELELLHTDEHGDIDFKVALENHMMAYFPNVIITPHNAFNSHEALMRIIKTTIENIVTYINGEPKNLVK